MVRWLYAASLSALCCCVFASPSTAAPARLNDEIPDAVPDPEGTWSFGAGYQGLDLEGPLASSSSTHSVYRLRYTFSPDAAGEVFYRAHTLGGGSGLISPLLDNHDHASAFGFDLRLNMLNEASRYEKLDDPASFVAGSAFDVGVSMEQLSLTAAALDQNDSLLRAYLAYSTDLSDQLRGHTFFSTGRVSGDTHTGSVNRIGAGLDYALSDGPHPLTLMADAVLDIYNFRRPTFNTSRITSFDVGLRYGLSRNLYGSLGWMTYNDSENDASGSGLFAGLQWLSETAEEDCIAVGPDLPPGELIVEPEATAVVPPVVAPAAEPAAAVEPPASPAVETVPAPAAEAVAEPPAAVTSPIVDSAPDPATESGPVAPEAPLVLPDARADAPALDRAVSALQTEFAAAEQTALESPVASVQDCKSLSLEDSGCPGPEFLESDESPGIEIPPLDLPPGAAQAHLGDVRPRLTLGRFKRKTSSAEIARASDNPAVVEVEVVPEGLVEDAT